MKPVDQREAKDCLRCCIASIFEIPWGDAPDTALAFLNGDERGIGQHNTVNEWLKERGLVEWQIDTSGPNPCLRRGEAVARDGSHTLADYMWPYPAAAHYVGGGAGPRGVGHSVVMFAGQIVHDPHPDRDMTVDRITSIHVYCARLA
jgi:hypothetical protein